MVNDQPASVTPHARRHSIIAPTVVLLLLLVGFWPGFETMADGRRNAARLSRAGLARPASIPRFRNILRPGQSVRARRRILDLRHAHFYGTQRRAILPAPLGRRGFWNRATLGNATGVR